MCLDGENDGFGGEALLQVVLQITSTECLQFQRVVGVDMFAIFRIKAVADVRHLAIFVGQYMSIGLVIGDGAIIERVWLGRVNECGCRWVASQKSLEGRCGCFEVCCFLDRIASYSFGFVERGFGSLKGTEDLEEGKKVLSCPGG